MKTYRLSFFLMLTVLMETKAQSKFCDEIVQLGDTVICRDFAWNKKMPFREQFYINEKRVFTRRWRSHKNGEFSWAQYQSNGAFAKENGPTYWYYSTGKVKSTTIYAHGKVVGPCREFYPSGAIKQYCQGHIKGKTDGTITALYESGQLQSRTMWENGRLMEVIQYKDEQGNDLPVGAFKEGNGEMLVYDHGKPFGAYRYKNGKYIGKKKLK